MEELLDEGVVKGGTGAIRGAEGGDGVVIEEERDEEGCGVAVVDGGDGVWQDPRPLGALAGIRTLSGVGAGHRAATEHVLCCTPSHVQNHDSHVRDYKHVCSSRDCHAPSSCRPRLAGSHRD